MLMIHGVTYVHPNGDVLFSNIDLAINKHDKIALIGNNGSGKSTLLHIITQTLIPVSGSVRATSKPYLVPQVFGQFNEYTVAQALGINDKINALKEILNGNVTEFNMALIGNDWAIEERCKEAFAYWKIGDVDPDQKMGTLSGGQKTKVFLAGIHIHNPEMVLLDEPTNHLDASGRHLLYAYIRQTKSALLVVSHDRTLLNLLDQVCELSKQGMRFYGGNYDFYAAQKQEEYDALKQDVKAMEKEIRKAKETEKETIERKQKLDARGKKKQEKAGLPTISMNTLRNNAEKSASRLKGIHEVKIDVLSKQLHVLREGIPASGKMKMQLEGSALHKEKMLIKAEGLNFGYSTRRLWPQSLDFQIRSGERVAIKGTNGSGKTSLIRMILGDLQPVCGTIDVTAVKTIYIDQDYSLINNLLTVYEQVQQFNPGVLHEHEIKTRLSRYLFVKTDWDKLCGSLSGGEKMRLLLCCLTVSKQAPDIIILDEPTNNLDIQNIEILTAAINEYKGTLIVVSHDERFLKEVNVTAFINLG